MSAANEVAVYAFLREMIPFGGIYACVEETLNRLGVLPARDLSDIREANRIARKTAMEILHIEYMAGQ